ncbi:site-specific integrase [Stenotrophomonas sp. YIM B06876]|uniref:site-specific integrase n=1 Tax=Stenotrophomonas sp. YIM B06876 TaxID=3060211 RepID=UPI0027385F78|nr:site-specific integrase [Stenotrophomonas sp. YIM B06876]
MGTITSRRRADGSTGYTAQIRLKRDGKIVHSEAETFSTKALAKEWTTRREAELAGQRARGETLGARMTVEQMIEWYQAQERPDNPWGRSKRADLARIKAGALAGKRVDKLAQVDFIAYTHARRVAGAGPATAANDLIWLRQVLRAARVALQVPVPMQALDEAAEYLRNSRSIGKPKQRDRRPTPAELVALEDHFAHRDMRAQIPMHDVMWFAILSARRQEEITRLRWEDIDTAKGVARLRDVKHPTKKLGNDRTFRLLQPALDIINAQPRHKLPDGTEDPLVFPYEPKSIGAAFTRACRVLGIKDLRFHDLRHEATSRLFEAGYSIQEVALFTLHDSWATLKRYANLRPEDIKAR